MSQTALDSIYNNPVMIQARVASETREALRNFDSSRSSSTTTYDSREQKKLIEQSKHEVAASKANAEASAALHRSHEKARAEDRQKELDCREARELMREIRGELKALRARFP